MTGPALLLLTTLLLWAIWPAEWLAAWYVKWETTRRLQDEMLTEAQRRMAARHRLEAKRDLALQDGTGLMLDGEEEFELARIAVERGLIPVVNADGSYHYVDDVEVDDDPPTVDLEQ